MFWIDFEETEEPADLFGFNLSSFFVKAVRTVAATALAAISTL